MNAAHGGGHGRGLPRSLLSGTLLSHGASAVARVSDRGRLAEVLPTYRNGWSSQSGPPLTPTMQAGQDSDGGVGVLEGICMLHAVIVLHNKQMCTLDLLSCLFTKLCI